MLNIENDATSVTTSADPRSLLPVFMEWHNFHDGGTPVALAVSFLVSLRILACCSLSKRI